MILLLALAIGAACGGGAHEPEREIWIAEARNAVDREAAPIRVFNPISGEERSLGHEAFYSGVAWSPDGRHLTAIEVTGTEEGGLPLWLFDWPGGEAKVIDVGEGWPSYGAWWSPDSTRIGVVIAPFDGSGRASVLVLDEEGNKLGAVPFPDGGPSGSSVGWSQDSRYFVASQGGEVLLVARRDGTGDRFETADLFPEGDQLTVQCWEADGQLSAAKHSRAREGQPEAEAVRLAISDQGTTIEVEELPAASFGCDHIFAHADDETLSRLVDAVPGIEFPPAPRRTADGSAFFSGNVATEADVLAPYLLAIPWDGDFVIAEGQVSERFAFIGGRSHVAVVVTGSSAAD